MEIKGKTALITGGSKRVGKAIALELARRGANILLHYRHSEKEAQETAVQIRSLGVSCETLQADLSRNADILRLVIACEAGAHPPDILVNSASLYYRTPVETLDEKSWDELIDANLKGPYLLSVETAKNMRRRGRGKIVNIADWSGFRPYKDFMPYCTSKGGLITLTKALAHDFAPQVLVNAVAPGPVLPPPDMKITEQEAVAKTTALGRWGKPEDIASSVAFVLENDFINGIVLVVDGGRSIV